MKSLKQYALNASEYVKSKMAKKSYMAFNPITTKYDDTYLSPNYSFFFARPLNTANTVPALLLGGIGDFGYSSSFDTDSTPSRGFDRQGVAGVKNEPARTSWEGSIDLSVLEMANVEAQQMLYSIHYNGEPVEIWEVKADKIAGAGYKDAEGNQVIEGRMADRYYVGRVDELDYENNAGDPNITYEYTVNLIMLPDDSWIDPIPVEAGGFKKAVNRSLKAYDESSDIPTNTQRDRYADSYEFSGDTTQTASSAVVTPDTPQRSTEE